MNYTKIDIFDEVGIPYYKITKPIRLIELFAGIGSQAALFDLLKYPIETHRVIEYDPKIVNVYNAMHDTTYLPTYRCY